MNNMYAATVFLSFVIGSVSVYYLGQDNPIEEIAENVIEYEIGTRIDLFSEQRGKNKL